MFTYNNNEFRNLQEQVQKNKEDIARHYEVTRVLEDFGIRVIGRLDTRAELDNVATDTLDYGDAYAIGTQPPYTFYIWTRANDDNPDSDYWFDMGQLAIEGPQGPAGAYVTTIAIDPNTFYPTFGFSNGTSITVPQSLRGPRGATGRTGQRGPQGVQGRTGERGPIGPTGAQGPIGPAGAFNIKGTLSSASLLPDATTMQPGDAYLVLAGTALYDLYVIVAPDSGDTSTYSWQNTGLLGAGTTITVNGSAVSSWNADTKLDKNTSTNTYDRAYVVTKEGTNTFYSIDKSATVNSIARRNADGTLDVAYPSQPSHAATLRYVDDAIAAIPTGGGGSSGGGSTTIDITSTNEGEGKGDLYWSLDSTVGTLLHTLMTAEKLVHLTVIYDGESMTIPLPPLGEVENDYNSATFSVIDPTGTIFQLEWYGDYKGFEIYDRRGDSLSWFYQFTQQASQGSTRAKVYLTY